MIHELLFVKVIAIHISVLETFSCCSFTQSLIMAAQVVTGRPLCFTPVIFLRDLIFKAEECHPAAPLPGRRHVVTQIRRGRAYPLHFEGQKSDNFAPKFGNGTTLNYCSLKTMLQIKKLKQMH